MVVPRDPTKTGLQGEPWGVGLTAWVPSSPRQAWLLSSLANQLALPKALTDVVALTSP